MVGGILCMRERERERRERERERERERIVFFSNNGIVMKKFENGEKS